MKIYKYKFLNIRILIIAYWCFILPFYGIGQPLCNSDAEGCISIGLVQIGGGSITTIPGYEDVGEVVMPCGYDKIYVEAKWEDNPDMGLNTWTFASDSATIMGDAYACVRGCSFNTVTDTVTISVAIDSLTTCECLMILEESIIPVATGTHIKLCDDEGDGIVKYDLNDIVRDSISTDDAVTISYHLSEAAAIDNTTPITDSIGINDAYTLYARVESDLAIGCFSVSEVSFEIQQNPLTVSLSADVLTLTCDRDSITLRAAVESNPPTPYFYNWFPAMGEGLTEVDQDTFVVSTVGRHTLIVKADACFNVTEIEIEGNFVAPEFADTAITTPDGTIVDCQQSPLSLIAHATSPNGDTLLYEWTSTNGNISTDPTQDSIMINTEGTYIVTVTQAETGCTVTDSIVMMYAGDTLELVVTPDMPALTCKDAAITLTADSPLSGVFSYIWNTGNTQATLDVDMPGTYSVTMTDNMSGCATDLEVIVTENINTPTINNGTLNGCDMGAGTGIFDLTNANLTNETNTTNSYYINVIDAETGDNPIANPTMYSSAEGAVFVRVAYAETGCFSIAEINLSLDRLEIPDIHFSPEVSELCEFYQIASVSITNPRPDYTYTWSMDSADPTNVMTIENCTALELPPGITSLMLAIQFEDCVMMQEYPVVRELQGIPQAAVLRLGPADILFCNRNDFVSYQWGREGKTDLCPEAINGAIYQDYIAENIDTDNYYYWVIVENESGCKEKIYYLENPFQRLPAPYTPYVGELTMQVFPNPNNGVFDVEIIGSEVLALDLYLYDAFGRKFFEQHIDKLNTIERVSLSFPSLPAGLYFIHITDSHDNIVVRRVVIL